MITSSRILAYFGFAGTILDVMGGLYMAYDILGGRAGPLSLITRVASYSMITGICYGVVLGPLFGLVTGLGVGVILGLEFHRVSRFQKLYNSSPLYQTPWFAVARGLVFGSAASLAFGIEFGALFGLFCGLGLYGLSLLRMNPTNDYIARPGFHLNRHNIVASFLRGGVIGLAGVGAATLETAKNYSVGFGVLVGGTVGAVSMLLTVVGPNIEWWIDNMPERQMLFMGISMVFLGFLLQSIQYLVVILGLHLPT